MNYTQGKHWHIMDFTTCFLSNFVDAIVAEVKNMSTNQRPRPSSLLKGRSEKTNYLRTLYEGQSKNK